jgi:hypothetical protein
MAKAPSMRGGIKALIWLYLALLIFEGALRKWYLPSLSNPLLIVRDPVVILIYLMALSNGYFPFNGFVMADVFLALLSFVGGVISPDSNIIVTLIGLRCYYLHLPLIFVMERVMDREDVLKMGRALIWLALPMTLLILDQFYSPQSARVNWEIGGKVGEGFSGALNRFRPTGTFSFTAGVSAFYPLVLAMLLAHLIGRRKLPFVLTVVAGLCVVISVPFSISRTNAMTCALVILVAGLALMIVPKPPLLIARTLLIVAVVACVVPFLHFFDEGVDTFESRWTDSTGNSVQDFQENIIDRFFDNLIPKSDTMSDAPLLGVGVGYGTNMAQAYLTGQRNFALSEDEWARLILELGPVVGLGFIFLRIALCGRLIASAATALRRNNVLPALISAEAVLLVLDSQWAQPTILGFATFSAGLALAAVRPGPATPAPARPAGRRRARPRLPVWHMPPRPDLPVRAPQS